MHPISFSFSNFTTNLEAEMERESELSRTSAEPFNMGYNEHNKVYLKFGNTEGKDKQNQNQSIVKVDHEIGKNVEGGILLNLTLKLHLSVFYKVWGKIWVPDVWQRSNAYCWDLVVGVMPDTGSGRLIITATKNCKYSY
ncbi:hypothetical protein COLO4_12369 [Corchorus olitorius]|uniref:Uncharacterized protein n=1 Tax=Corchorus olitorius TaxID=93759 RepID=A0A1R3K1D0_9ROSI|nr:hypothetical protein COLO4_12369 [Corchorus olitorius]